MQGMGAITVTRSQDCAGYLWNINWIDGGNKQPITVWWQLSLLFAF